MNFYDKFVDRFQNLSKVKNPVDSKGLIISERFQKKTFREYDAILLTMLYVKVFHTMVSQKF